jgi:S1-C subfamily serine protease
MFLKKFVYILLSANSVLCFNFNKLIVTCNLDNYKNKCDNLRRNILYTGVGLSSYNLLKPIKTNAETTNNLLNYIEEKQKELYDKTLSSVCYISTEYTSMGEKFNLNSEDLPKGVGTGFVWDKSGHIITNFHVINKVDNALVTITKKNKETITYNSKLTGIDPDNDLAILKIDAQKDDLQIINYNPKTIANVGQFAFAIGNPFGQDHTLTTGIISGINRELSAPTGRKIYNVIQTDAAINPGNSGGPLLNSNGELLGINTASLGMGVSAGIGFTIPINNVINSINDIINTGYVQKPILGITYMERNPSESESLKSGLPIIKRGILILEVPNDSPAFGAGLQGIKKNNETQKIERVGDIIIGIDNNKINDPKDLYAILKKYKSGDKIKLKYIRKEKEYITDLILGNYKGATFTKLENERGVDFDKTSRKIDIPLKNLEPKIEPKLN